LSSELDTRLRDDPACPPELLAYLDDSANGWPDAEQLSALRQAIHSQLASEAKLPRLRSPASGAAAQLRRALEDDFKELPTGLEIADLRDKLTESLRVSNSVGPRPTRRLKRRWLRALLVAALIALPAIAAAFVGYRLLAKLPAPRVAPEPSGPLRTPSPQSLPSAGVVSPPAPTPTELPSQQVPTPPIKPSSAPVNTPAKAGAKAEFELIGDARAKMTSSPAEALALAAEHARQFPSGVLVQERELIAIESLERLGRTAEAKARAQRFATRFPGSAHLARLKRLLEPKTVRDFGI